MQRRGLAALLMSVAFAGAAWFPEGGTEGNAEVVIVQQSATSTVWAFRGHNT